MSKFSKISIIAGIVGMVILLKNIKSQSTSLGAYNTNSELTEIWGKKALFTAIPGLGMATTIFDSLKAIAKDNNNRKGVRRYGR